MTPGLPPPFTPAVTVVVPTRNAARTIDNCLRSIRFQHFVDAAGRRLRMEVVVVDNASADDTVQRATALATNVVVGGPERSAQRNIGAAGGRGRHVAFVDADMVLEPTVLAEAVRLLDEDPSVGLVIVPEISFGRSFWARCKVLEKQLAIGNAQIEAARVYRRTAFEQAGGWDPALTAAEDWDLHDRVVAGGWQVARTRARILHDEGRLRLADAYRKKRYYGRWLPLYASRPWARPGLTDPRRLLSQPRLLLRHPVRACGLVVLKAVEALGATRGMHDSRPS